MRACQVRPADKRVLLPSAALKRAGTARGALKRPSLHPLRGKLGSTLVLPPLSWLARMRSSMPCSVAS